MSNPLKSVGKIFKKVVSVAKKVALPALAIGAVVLTGGAALGVFGAGGLTGVIGSLGLSPALSGILVGAAKSAAFGAVGSALTGGSIIKGATTGFILGGAMGGIGALTAGGTGAAAQAAKTAAQGATNGLVPGAADAAKAAAGGGLGGGAGSIASQGMGWLDGVGGTVASGPAQVVAPAVTTAAVPTSGGILSSITQNPQIMGQMLNGLGQGMMASEQAKEWKKKAAYQDAKWDGVDGFFEPMAENNAAGLGAAYNSRIYGGTRLNYDPRTGKVIAAA